MQNYKHEIEGGSIECVGASVEQFIWGNSSGDYDNPVTYPSGLRDGMQQLDREHILGFLLPNDEAKPAFPFARLL